MINFILFFINVYKPTTLVVPPFKHTLGYNRASIFYLKMYLGPGFNIKAPEGIAAVKLKELDNPKTHKDDDDLTVIAVNSGACEIVYNVGFKKLARFGKKGDKEGQFQYPHGIALNPDGTIFIADTYNNRVVKLKYTQGKINWITSFDNGFNLPYDVAMDSKKNVYITDRNNNRIVIMDENGSIKKIISEGLYIPTGIAVIRSYDKYNTYRDNYIAVIDNHGKRINLYSPEGKLLSMITARDIGLEDAQFSYACIDKHGNLYVTDRLNHQIHKFDNKLNYIISMGKEGSKSYEFFSPRGIAIWRRFGQVFIAEKDGGQYYWIGVDGYIGGAYPNPVHKNNPGTTISIYLTEQAQTKIYIYNSKDKLVKQLTPRYTLKIGENLIVWDLTDNKNNPVPFDTYTVKAEIRATYSSRRYFKKELEYKIEYIK